MAIRRSFCYCGRMRRPFAKTVLAVPRSARQFFVILMAFAYLFAGAAHHAFCQDVSTKSADVVEMASSSVGKLSAKLIAVTCEHCSHCVEHLRPSQGGEFSTVLQSERVEKAALALSAYPSGMDTPPPRIRV